jgi:RNA polymerase sigma factor (sigma-70 family)
MSIDLADYLGMAHWLADRSQRRGIAKHLDHDDAYSECLVALVQARNNFDPDRGLAFTTYAYAAMWHQLLQADKSHNCEKRKPRPPNYLIPIDGDRRNPLYVPYQDAEPEHYERGEVVCKLLTALSPRERMLVEEMYGLGGQSPARHKLLAVERGISSQRVSQLVEVALAKMRRAYEKEYGPDETPTRSYTSRRARPSLSQVHNPDHPPSSLSPPGT